MERNLTRYLKAYLPKVISGQSSPVDFFSLTVSVLSNNLSPLHVEMCTKDSKLVYIFKKNISTCFPSPIPVPHAASRS